MIISIDYIGILTIPNMPTIQVNTQLQYINFITLHKKYFQPHVKNMKKSFQPQVKKHKKWCQPGANKVKLYPFNTLLENKKPSN